MLFNSFEFLILISCAFALYYTPGFSRFQVPILLGASLIFYGSFQPTLLLLLLLSLAINIITSHLVIIGPPDRRRTYATLGVVFNLCILVFFKYGPLFVNTMPIDTVETLRTSIAALKPGDPVALQVERDGGLLYVTFEVE